MENLIKKVGAFIASVFQVKMYMPSKWAKRDWQKRQEKNLIYVAITRAKMELYFIGSGSMERSK